jgi:hypothetical protein
LVPIQPVRQLLGAPTREPVAVPLDARAAAQPAVPSEEVPPQREPQVRAPPAEVASPAPDALAQLAVASEPPGARTAACLERATRRPRRAPTVALPAAARTVAPKVCRAPPVPRVWARLAPLSMDAVARRGAAAERLARLEPHWTQQQAAARQDAAAPSAALPSPLTGAAPSEAQTSAGAVQPVPARLQPRRGLPASARNRNAPASGVA